MPTFCYLLTSNLTFFCRHYMNHSTESKQETMITGTRKIFSFDSTVAQKEGKEDCFPLIPVLSILLLCFFFFRVVLRCRQLARERFAKLRSDVLVKLELLDQKHGEFTLLNIVYILTMGKHWFLEIHFSLFLFSVILILAYFTLFVSDICCRRVG